MRRIKYFIYFIIIFLFILLCKNSSISSKIVLINTLNDEYYSYLPNEAKEFIESIYYETGNIILTEKNKEDNIPYLNPEYIKYLSLSEEEKSSYEVIPDTYKVDYIIVNDNIQGNISSSYDLRNVNGKNFTSRVGNQGDLSICWSFASAGSAESYLLKKSDTSYNSSSTLFSERQIDYATSSDGINNFNSEFQSLSKRTLGSGGSFTIASYALASGISFVDYNNFKTSLDLNKLEMSDVFSINNSLYELNSTINMPNNSLRASTSNLSTNNLENRNNYINAIKDNIENYGAAYVSTYWNPDCMILDSNNNVFLDVYNCGLTNGHALNIIGWDDNYSYSYCADGGKHSKKLNNCLNIVNGTGAWILKNSWGEEYSYPYLSYDSLESKIYFITDITSSSDRTWDNNYSVGDGKPLYKIYTTVLSNTPINNVEKLKKVKFYTSVSGGTYTIKILQSNNTYKTYSKSQTYPGLLTFDISDDVLINKNSTIEISSNIDNYTIYNKVLVFTKNISNDIVFETNGFDNPFKDKNIILYSNSKNIPSGSYIDYKLYNLNDQNISNLITISNNKVGYNNVNTYFSISNNLSYGIYKLKAFYNNNVIDTVYLKYNPFDGEGTSESPYLIKNPIDLSYIEFFPASYYLLNNDIDLSYDTTNSNGHYYNNGHGFKGISNFSGSFNGNGHTISGLYQNNYIDQNNYRSDSNGLFSSLYNEATISDLTLKDFDITCYSGYCGTLFSTYSSSNNYTDTNKLVIKNIALIGGKVTAKSGNEQTKLGGLYGTINGAYNASISNIFIDSYLKNTSGGGTGYFAYNLGNNVNEFLTISNVELLGDVYPLNDSSLINSFDYEIKSSSNITISNILSTLYNDSIGSFTSKKDSSKSNSINLNNINVINNNNDDYSSNLVGDNINIYNNISDLLNDNNYSTWTNFSTNWNTNIINNVKRIPTLKFVNINFTNTSSISLLLNSNDNLFNHISSSYNRIRYIINDPSIVSIDSLGVISTLKEGNTTIHIENLYDGYIYDIPINVIVSSVIFSNNKYSYNDEYSIIYDINSNTLLNDFISNLSLNSIYNVEIVSSYDKLNTGSKTRIKLNNEIIKEYTNIVLGDINGDSKISSADYVKVRKHIMQSEVINDSIIFNAADVNKDGKISSADYVKIRRYIMNGSEEGL